MRRPFLLFAALIATMVLAGTSLAAQGARPAPTPGANFRIVVIEGEDPVNVVQQRTAVAPVVEVRDRNDQPVAGVVVSFAIRRGPARFAGGARTFTATTNAAGRITSGGLTPTGTGGIRIGITARVQGQTITATVTQSNVATAAEAQALQAARATSTPGSSAGGGAGSAGSSAAGGAGGTGATAAGATAGAAGAAGAGVGAGTGAAAGATAGAAGAGASGGLSAAAIGGIAAGAGGGALVAVKAAQSEPAPTAAPVTYSGSYSGQYVLSTGTAFPTNPTNCVSTRTIAGTLSMTLTTQTSGAVSGSAQIPVTQTPVSEVGCTIPFTGSSSTSNSGVAGTTSNVTFSTSSSYTGTVAVGGTISGTSTVSFSGVLSGGTITGTLSFTQSASGTSDGSGGRPPSPITQGGSTAIAVTLR